MVRLGTEIWEPLTALQGDVQLHRPDLRERARRAAEHLAGLADREGRDGRAGLGEAVSPHWLRHAHATHALVNGASLGLVKTTLGSSSIAVTDIDTHVAPEEGSALYVAA
ncbi:MAG: hypothetical protein OHK0015_41970 [Chloroflexi bacterium OHK40]